LLFLTAKETTSFSAFIALATLKKVTPSELEKMQQQESLEQKKSYADNQAKKCDRIAKYSLDEDNQKAYRHRAEQWEEKSEIIEEKLNKTVANSAESDKINRVIPVNIQLFAKKSEDFATIILPREEYAHVMSEIATNLTETQASKKVFTKAIGDYKYTVENNGFGNYRVIGKKLIK
jgi:predicted transcriptional regulator YdeE